MGLTAFSFFQKRAHGLRQSIQETATRRDQVKIQSLAFSQLRLQEMQAIPSRLETMRRQVSEQQKRQTELQLQYKGLADQVTA